MFRSCKWLKSATHFVLFLLVCFRVRCSSSTGWNSDCPQKKSLELVELMILHQPMIDLKFDKQRPRKYGRRGHGPIAWTVKQDLRLPSKEAASCCIIAICQVIEWFWNFNRQREDRATIFPHPFHFLLVLIQFIADPGSLAKTIPRC